MKSKTINIIYKIHNSISLTYLGTQLLAMLVHQIFKSLLQSSQALPKMSYHIIHPYNLTLMRAMSGLLPALPVFLD